MSNYTDEMKSNFSSTFLSQAESNSTSKFQSIQMSSSAVSNDQSTTNLEISTTAARLLIPNNSTNMSSENYNNIMSSQSEKTVEITSSSIISFPKAIDKKLIITTEGPNTKIPPKSFESTEEVTVESTNVKSSKPLITDSLITSKNTSKTILTTQPIVVLKTLSKETTISPNLTSTTIKISNASTIMENISTKNERKTLPTTQKPYSKSSSKTKTSTYDKTKFDPDKMTKSYTTVTRNFIPNSKLITPHNSQKTKMTTSSQTMTTNKMSGTKSEFFHTTKNRIIIKKDRITTTIFSTKSIQNSTNLQYLETTKEPAQTMGAGALVIVVLLPFLALFLIAVVTALRRKMKKSGRRRGRYENRNTETKLDRHQSQMIPLTKAEINE